MNPANFPLIPEDLCKPLRQWFSYVDKKDPLVEPAIRLIQNEYGDSKLNNVSLVKKCGISEVYFQQLFTLAACGESADVQQNDTSAADTTAAETDSRFVSDVLPDNLDFGGKTVTWYVGDYMSAYYDDLLSTSPSEWR